MKKKSTQRLPPDNDSFKLRAMQVNYQTYLYLNFQSKETLPSPRQFGWTIVEGNLYISLFHFILF